MGDIAALLERVRAAKGPDYEIDCEIAQALEFETTFSEDDGSCFVRFQPGALIMLPVPSYTASVDAALALVERKLPGAEMKLQINGPDRDWQTACVRVSPLTMLCGECPTLPLAIVSALLQALKDSSHE